jgi:hypothetical protein
VRYLDSVDERLRVRLELPFTFFQLIWAGGDHTSGTNGCLGDISVTLLNENYPSANLNDLRTRLQSQRDS